MEPDFKNLKRKNLQRLCKRHGLRANATNSQMVDSLASIFKICKKSRQVKARLNRFDGSRMGEVESGDAEMVVIVIDEDEEEPCSALKSKDKKALTKSQRSSVKDKLFESHSTGLSECCNSEGTGVKWLEENGIILLDDVDDETSSILRRSDRKISRRSSRRVGRAYSPSRSNEQNKHVGVLRNPNEELSLQVHTTSYPETHSPVSEKMKTYEGKTPEIGTRKENLSTMNAARDAKSDRKLNCRNSSSLPINVWGAKNLKVEEGLENCVNSGTGSAVTFEMDRGKVANGTAEQNEQEYTEKDEMSNVRSLMEIVGGSVPTQIGKKRRRTSVEDDNSEMIRKTDKLGIAKQSELAHKDVLVEPEVYFSSSKMLGNQPSFNITSSRLCLQSSGLNHGQKSMEANDTKAIENCNQIFLYGTDEKKSATIIKEKFRLQRQKRAMTNSEQNSGLFNSVIFNELYQLKSGEPAKFENDALIIQEKLKNNEEIVCNSEEPQAVSEKVEDIAPFRLSERVDNLIEKLLCLKKMLRGEIASLDSSLPNGEEEMVVSRMKELTSQPCSPKVCLHSGVNIPVKSVGDSIICSNNLQGSLELCNFMESCKFLDKNKLDFPSKQCSTGLKIERNPSASCSSKKIKLNSSTIISPAKNTKYIGNIWLSETFDRQSSLPIIEANVKQATNSLLNTKYHEKFLTTIIPTGLQEKLEVSRAMESSCLHQCDYSYNGHTYEEHNKGNHINIRLESLDHSIARANTFAEVLSSEIQTSSIYLNRKGTESNISSTPATYSMGNFNLGLAKEKENTESRAKMKCSSKCKMRVGSTRRPLQSITNQMIEYT